METVSILWFTTSMIPDNYSSCPDFYSRGCTGDNAGMSDMVWGYDLRGANVVMVFHEVFMADHGSCKASRRYCATPWAQSSSAMAAKDAEADKPCIVGLELKHVLACSHGSRCFVV